MSDSSPRSTMSIRSTSSLSNTVSRSGSLRHKHNDYSCYIYVINKTEVNLQLVDAKSLSGRWAPGSPPNIIEPNRSTLIELNDPRGPHGSEGWCSYRLHHPRKSNAINFRLSFSDPYWAKDDNFLRATTQDPTWIALNTLKYASNGHPFIAYVEVHFLRSRQIGSKRGRLSRGSSVKDIGTYSDDDEPLIRGSSSDVVPRFSFAREVEDDLKKPPVQTIQPVDDDDDSGYVADIRNDSAIVLVDENATYNDDDDDKPTRKRAFNEDAQMKAAGSIKKDGNVRDPLNNDDDDDDDYGKAQTARNDKEVVPMNVRRPSVIEKPIQESNEEFVSDGEQNHSIQPSSEVKVPSISNSGRPEISTMIDFPERIETSESTSESEATEAFDSLNVSEQAAGQQSADLSNSVKISGVVVTPTPVEASEPVEELAGNAQESQNLQISSESEDQHDSTHSDQAVMSKDSIRSLGHDALSEAKSSLPDAEEAAEDTKNHVALKTATNYSAKDDLTSMDELADVSVSRDAHHTNNIQVEPVSQKSTKLTSANLLDTKESEMEQPSESTTEAPVVAINQPEDHTPSNNLGALQGPSAEPIQELNEVPESREEAIEEHVTVEIEAAEASEPVTTSGPGNELDPAQKLETIGSLDETCLLDQNQVEAELPATEPTVTSALDRAEEKSNSLTEDVTVAPVQELSVNPTSRIVATSPQNSTDPDVESKTVVREVEEPVVENSATTVEKSFSSETLVGGDKVQQQQDEIHPESEVVEVAIATRTELEPKVANEASMTDGMEETLENATEGSIQLQIPQREHVIEAGETSHENTTTGEPASSMQDARGESEKEPCPPSANERFVETVQEDEPEASIEPSKVSSVHSTQRLVPMKDFSMPKETEPNVKQVRFPQEALDLTEKSHAHHKEAELQTESSRDLESSSVPSSQSKVGEASIQDVVPSSQEPMKELATQQAPKPALRPILKPTPTTHYAREPRRKLHKRLMSEPVSFEEWQRAIATSGDIAPKQTPSTTTTKDIPDITEKAQKIPQATLAAPTTIETEKEQNDTLHTSTKVDAVETQTKASTETPVQPEPRPSHTRSLNTRPSSQWEILKSPHVKMGIVAFVFLTSWGVTLTRISGGLFFGRRRR